MTTETWWGRLRLMGKYTCFIVCLRFENNANEKTCFVHALNAPSADVGTCNMLIICRGKKGRSHAFSMDFVIRCVGIPLNVAKSNWRVFCVKQLKNLS
jgi:hypothetical protein